jgi:hypothetical protein
VFHTRTLSPSATSPQDSAIIASVPVPELLIVCGYGSGCQQADWPAAVNGQSKVASPEIPGAFSVVTEGYDSTVQDAPSTWTSGYSGCI